jgi:hypothetical protein
VAEFKGRDLHLVKKALAIQQQPPASDRSDMNAPLD